MGLHRLTPVMTSAQRHNKANSRLLQVQLLGLPGGEQKTPKKRCHVVGGDSRVPPELLRAGRHAHQQLHSPILAAPSPGAGDSGAFGVARLQRAGEGEAQPHVPPLPPLCPFDTKPKQNALRGQPRHFLLQLRLFKARAWQKASRLILLQTKAFRSLCLAPFRKEAAEIRRHHVPSYRSYFTVTSCWLPWQPQAGPVLLPVTKGMHVPHPSSPSPSPRPICASAKPKILLQRGRGLLLRRCHLQVGLEEPSALLHAAGQLQPQLDPAASSPRESKQKLQL